MKLRLHPRLIAAASLAVLTSLIAQGVLSGPWQGVAVAAIAGISALVTPTDGRNDDEP